MGYQYMVVYATMPTKLYDSSDGNRRAEILKNVLNGWASAGWEVWQIVDQPDGGFMIVLQAEITPPSQQYAAVRQAEPAPPLPAPRPAAPAIPAMQASSAPAMAIPAVPAAAPAVPLPAVGVAAPAPAAQPSADSYAAALS